MGPRFSVTSKIGRGMRSPWEQDTETLVGNGVQAPRSAVRLVALAVGLVVRVGLTARHCSYTTVRGLAAKRLGNVVEMDAAQRLPPSAAERFQGLGFGEILVRESPRSEIGYHGFGLLSQSSGNSRYRRAVIS